MRTFILLLTTIILSSFSIAQKDTDLNERVESYIAHSNLNMSRLEKLEAIRTNTSLDSLKREKKWQKAYEKWDPSNETANFPIAGSILSSIGPEKWRYTATLSYPDFSNEFLAWLVDMRITQGKGLTEQVQMFIRNVLKRRKDVSEELITKECEKIFVEANRFGKDTPILPTHFEVMASYIRATHPDAKGFAEFADLLRRYESEDIVKLITHAEKSGLSLNQLNTIPPLRHYSTDLSIGRLFRDDLLRCHELYRHSHGGRIYLTPELWDRYKFTMYEQFFNDQKIGNMLLGMICYKKWLDHEYKRLDNSQAGVYVNGIIHRKASFLYDEIQKSQLKQLRLNMPYDPYADEPFIELLTAAHNGVFFLPTDLRTRTVENIEKIEVNGNFQLTEKERTVVDAIGPYGIRYQGEQILSNQPWLSEHAKNPEFRFAVMLKLAQMAMNANTDWYYQMGRYDARPFVSVPKAMELERSESEVKRQRDRWNSIKKSLAKGLEKYHVGSGKYIITCEGRRHVEIYPEVAYTVNAWVMGELERLGVESLKQEGLPGYSRFIVYVNETAPDVSYIGEIVQDEEVEYMEEIHIMPPPVPEFEEEFRAATPPPPPPAPVMKHRPERVVQAEVIDFPDVEANFPGGTGAMQVWLKKNLRYPKDALEKGEQGRVYVSFVVEIDGNISNVKVERGVTKELDREARRLISAMPKWTAGEAGGKKVRTRCRLPVIFKIE